MALLNLIKTELRLDLKRMLTYRVSVISDLVVFASVILTTFLTGLDNAFARGFSIDPFSGKMLVLIGFVFWQISVTAMGWCAAAVEGQTVNGTFELKMHSQFPVPLMLFIEMLTYLLFSFVSLSIILIIYLLISGGSLLQALYIPLSYLVALPGIAGMFGIGLGLGGLSLREKQTGNLVFILQTVLLFISDFITVQNRWFNIIPYNAGIKIMRSLYLSHPVQGVWIADYLIVNLVWLFVGCVIFKALLARERKYGAFDSY